MTNHSRSPMPTASYLSIALTPEISISAHATREHVPALECFRIPLTGLQSLATSHNIPPHLLSFPAANPCLRLQFFMTHRSNGYPSVSNITISYESSCEDGTGAPASTVKISTPNLRMDDPSIPPATAIAEELIRLIHQFLWCRYWLSILEKHCLHHGMTVSTKGTQLIVPNVATLETFFSTQTVYATFDPALNRPIVNAGLANTRSTNSSFLTPVLEQLVQAHTDYQASYLAC